jgi:uncharacterized protein (DUF3084 family)
VTPTTEALLIATLPPTIASVGALALGFLNRRELRLSAQKLQDIHLEINSRMTQLLELTRTSSHAEGVRDGKQPDA